MAKNPKLAVPDATARRLTLALAILEPLSVAGLFIFLLVKTWRRWPDPLIDFPRELYTAWRMSEGDLLYVNVTSWYGPLPHFAEAAAFRVFGVGMDTLIWLNVAVTITVVLLIRGVFGGLGGRLVAWLCSVVFLVVFAFGHFVGIGNYNFITPYASQATWGVLGLLLTVWSLQRHANAGKRRWLILAGAGAGVTYLCKPEPLLAAGGAVAVYLAAVWLRDGRAAHRGWGQGSLNLLRALGWLTVGFLGLWTPMLLVLGVQGGLGYAWNSVNWVPIFSRSVLQTGLTSVFNAQSLGFDEPAKNFQAHLRAATVLVLPCAAIIFGGWVWMRAKKFSVVWWTALVAVMGLGLAAGWRVTWLSLHPPTPPAWVFTWSEIGKTVVFPVALAAVVVELMSFWAGWKRREDFARTSALAVAGTAAALMLARMPLNGRIWQYGFFMMPLAVLFLVHLLAGEAPRRLRGTWRANWLLQMVFALLVLGGTIFLGRQSFGLYELKTYPVGAGRDQFYTFEPKVSPSGLLLGEMIKAVKQRTPQAQTLIAFPESSALNYHLRLRNPIPEMEFQPTTLEFSGRERVLKHLADNPPDAVLIYSRDMREYGVMYFGADENSGLAIAQWLSQNYRLTLPPIGTSPFTITGHAYDLLIRTPNAPAPPPGN